MPGTFVVKVLVRHGAARAGVELYAGGDGDLVFRDEANREQQRVAGDGALGAGDGGEILVYARNLDRFESVMTNDAGDGGGRCRGMPKSSRQFFTLPEQSRLRRA